MQRSKSPGRSPTPDELASVRLPGPQEYLAGVCGGFAKVITGHPFDTVKGRVQAGAFPTAMEALKQTVAKEGPRALYQGMVPPCISVGCVSGILFFVNSRITAALQPDRTKPLTYQQMFCAGGGAGAVTALILTPLDQMKIWMQVEKRACAKQSATTAAEAAKAVAPPNAASYMGHMTRSATQIGGAQLYRGFVSTTLREIGTFGIFFPCNDFMKKLFTGSDTSNGSPAPQHVPLSTRIAAAGISGVLCWLPCYPIDVIKTRQQLQGNPNLPAIDGGAPRKVPMLQGHSMITVAKQVLREEGLRGFSRGLTPCLLRAFPTYTAQFTLFDVLQTKLRARQWNLKEQEAAAHA